MVNCFALRWLDSTRGARASDCQRKRCRGPVGSRASCVPGSTSTNRWASDRLREQLGTSSSETLSRFRSTIGSRASPALPRLALLGEMVVHGEDIRRPLGLVRDYPAAALVALLRY